MGQNTTTAARIHYAAALGVFLNPLLLITSIALPLVVLIFSDTDDFSRKHGWQAIKFQILVYIYGIIVTIIFFVNLMLWGVAPAVVDIWTASPGVLLGTLSGLGFSAVVLVVIGIILWLMAFLLPFRAAGQAGEGLPYTYPFTFSRKW